MYEKTQKDIQIGKYTEENTQKKIQRGKYKEKYTEKYTWRDIQGE